jgi:DNA polymerase I-like protein with 3'-5' exonuclease and polymerase domains
MQVHDELMLEVPDDELNEVAPAPAAPDDAPGRRN